MHPQSIDPNCHQAVVSVRRPNSALTYNIDGVVLRFFQVEGVFQQFSPAALGPTIVRLYRYSLLAVHSGARRVYDKMRLYLSCSYIASDVYRSVVDCPLCAQNSKTNDKRRDLCLFPPSRPLKHVAMDIFGPLPKVKPGNEFTILLKGRY